MNIKKHCFFCFPTTRQYLLTNNAKQKITRDLQRISTKKNRTNKHQPSNNQQPKQSNKQKKKRTKKKNVHTACSVVVSGWLFFLTIFLAAVNIFIGLGGHQKRSGGRPRTDRLKDTLHFYCKPILTTL